MDCILALNNALSPDCVLTNELMSAHTTFKVGGPAKYFVMPKDKEEVKKAIEIAREYGIKYMVVGNGSNLLVSDSGYDGMIILIGKKMSKSKVTGNRITAQAGITLSALFQAAKKESLAGFEFAAGIPGTLGGACFMNAGAYGGEMKDVLVNVVTLDTNGEFHTYSAEEMDLSYRHSIFQKKNEIIVEATIELEKGDIEEITNKALELSQKRKEKQPLEYPSAGSTFKRPEGYFAGALIEEAGLKGKGIGGAEVSTKHAGFVINKNNASAMDVYNTIQLVIKEVKANSSVTLEPEVLIIGEF